MRGRAKFLVLTGDGINCERETARAFQLAGGEGTIVHINDLLQHPSRLKEFQGLALPGGFSFGDELGSGQLLALKILHEMGEEFQRFVDDKKPILGICNGFQVLAKLGIFPLGLAHNGKFIDAFVELNVHGVNSPWMRDLPPKLTLPIRNGEGRVVCNPGKIKDKQIALTYQNNPNFSHQSIAGVVDSSGLILGMMPHPEAFLEQGKKIFENIVFYLNAS